MLNRQSSIQKALGLFTIAEESIKKEIGKITSEEDKQLNLRLFEVQI